ncbi:MAG: N-acetylneuraminate synthase family protein [Anaerolineales bacterium]|nr:N-acetylneuraminate synthase family protein [Anaerolineales bacterium]
MPRKLIINNFEISDSSDCYVIAEIGHNHQGSLEKAKQLFKAAAECGVNAVKLQKRDNKSLFTKAAYYKPYENENSFGLTYGEHREFLEFGKAEYVELQKYAKELGVTMFATAFDIPSADFLAELDLPVYKIASGDLKNTPLLKHVAKFGKPMIISTGGANMEDVQRAYDAIMPINNQLAILQCTSSYPAEHHDLNLRVIETFRHQFPDTVIGLSDHENGIAMATAAYILGMRIIEQHFTINHTWKGTDQVFSLEPIGMKKLVRDLRRVREALGDGIKHVLPNEVGPISKMSKKLVAKQNLPAGQVLTEADIAVKSPGDGLPPYELYNILGKTLKRPLAEDEDIMFEDLA